MVSPGTPSRAKLAPRLTIPARDALLSFVFDDARSDDPVMDFGDRWCEWDGGPPAPAEVLDTRSLERLLWSLDTQAYCWPWKQLHDAPPIEDSAEANTCVSLEDKRSESRRKLLTGA